MTRRGESSRQRQRAQVAAEAARLLAGGTEDDPVRARHRAAQALGVRDAAALPGGDEIRAALAAHRGLFAANGAAASLRVKREAALAAMAHFAAFDPRLLGPVLDGSADGRDPVRLHLHAEDPDAVAHALLESRIPARQSRSSLHLDRQQRLEVPVWSFTADGVDFELVQLPLSASRQPPRDPLEDRPLARAGIAALRRLLEQDDQTG